MRRRRGNAPVARSIASFSFPPLAIDAIEAALALAACISVRDHLLDQRNRVLTAWNGSSVGSVGGKTRIDMRHEVEADQIEQAEHAGLRNAHRLADDGVGLLEVEPDLERLR